MGIFSEALAEMDRNTVAFMIDEIQKKNDQLQSKVAQIQQEKDLLQSENEQLKQKLYELEHQSGDHSS